MKKIVTSVIAASLAFAAAGFAQTPATTQAPASTTPDSSKKMVKKHKKVAKPAATSTAAGSNCQGSSREVISVHC